MLGNSLSFATLGIDARTVSIECDTAFGLYNIVMVGLPTGSVKESSYRVMAALKNSGFETPAKRYTINLAPADIRKESASLDLPIAISVLQAINALPVHGLDRIGIIGELSLDGNVRPVKGVLPIALEAKKLNLDALIVPWENADEAAIIEGLTVIPVTSLRETANYLLGKAIIPPKVVDREAIFSALNEFPVDMADVKGQFQVKRALEVAAAGGHNILMIGPPGSGKTMLARRVPTILPGLTIEEALEATKIHSVAGNASAFTNGILTTRPFRSPHHTISDIALIGGGSYPKPGEVSLAHCGVLFLDELPEFKRTVLEVLRQPLEDGIVTISRATQTLAFPAEFNLIASMNPCPCGYYGSNIPNHACTCDYGNINRYRGRVSGPLLDRIDIHIEVPAVTYADLSSLPTGETSAQIRERVNTARDIQRARFKTEKIFCNAQMTSKLSKKHCQLTPESHALLQNAIDRLGYSARVFDRILKVARTIADLEGVEQLKPEHISEAIQYRTLDRKFWE